jgi:hypothetical protein
VFVAQLTYGRGATGFATPLEYFVRADFPHEMLGIPPAVLTVPVLDVTVVVSVLLAGAFLCLR